MRGLVESDVVIGELTDERRSRGHGRVVGVGAVRVGGRWVAVDGGIDDQGLGPGRQVVLGVHDPARLPTSSSAARTVSLAAANGGNDAEDSAEEMGVARRPGPAPTRGSAAAAASPTNTGAAPVPVATKTGAGSDAHPTKNCRRDGPGWRLSLLILFLSVRFSIRR